MDGSDQILVKELATLYNKFWANEPPSLADLPTQYRDHVSWERNDFQVSVLTERTTQSTYLRLDKRIKDLF